MASCGFIKTQEGKEMFGEAGIFLCDLALSPEGARIGGSHLSTCCHCLFSYVFDEVVCVWRQGVQASDQKRAARSSGVPRA